ncbi:anti-phage ZorAB system protein ZorA [Coralloluteibacterium stylophorae]|uniref:Methyl-accepting chemotaxis protein n=1 Tax=Coralloluteibacterium stylophorae TaxID=1776034 RepID=A0AAP2C8A0_9GAMM|nr:anti-phage ZorAB system protein ZorA [Coralloluteibacterium stylophorae]MBS7455705.1 methyl-accepting chemotaxis protein [Coralloluteibacterium stylophorae]
MDVFWAALTGDALHMGIGALVAALSLAFLWFVVVQGIWLWCSLRRARGALKRVAAQPQPDPRPQLAQVFAGRRYIGLWREYEETLHAQRSETDIERSVQAVRATVPAESFFNGELIVDARLHTEFFKHLPGIFTGLGIIATFSGLIAGLQSFDVTAIDPEALKQSLGGLFGHVWNAFMLSAVAIALAMICTIIEKLVYASTLHQTAGIAAELDGLFKAGVGEEYLSRLVASSTEGTAQTKQLKESLVEDLKALLTNLTEQQIQATRQLSMDIGSNLESSLQEPLRKIADTVNVASRDQSESAGRMIENLMTAFMAQMRDTMGGQMGELSAMMRQSAEAVTQVEASLRTLVGDMQRASQSSSEGVQAAMAELMTSLASHERQQSEAVGNAQVQMLAQIQAATEKMAAAQESTSSRVNSAAAEASDRISAAAAEAQRASDQAAARAVQLATEMGETTLGAIGQLESGAARIADMLAALDGAAARLGQSGSSLAGVQQQAAGLVGQIRDASELLRRSSDTVAASSGSLAKASAQIELVSGSMASEADARDASLREVQAAMLRSREAAEEFKQFSGLVTDKMAEAVGTFGDRTVAVLDRNLVSFDKELTNAVDSLRQLMERLAILAADRVEA